MKQNRIWISWGFQRRSFELSREFDAAYFDFSGVSQNRYRRYLQCIPKTVQLLRRSKAETIFAQNPSLVLSIIVALGSRIFRYRYVNDLHTPYLKLNPIFDRIFWSLQEFCIRRSEITMVTNRGLAGRFPEADNLYLLPDKLPNVETPRRAAPAGAFNLLFPCTFAVDEPFEEVRKAAEMLDADVHIYVTGRYSKAGWAPREMPANLHLTGFIDESEYVALLNSVDAVLALTSQESCLLCGAYESMAAGKPLVLSDTKALREYFTAGAVYVAGDANSIAAGVRELRRTADTLRSEVMALRITLEENWRRDFRVIQERLGMR